LVDSDAHPEHSAADPNTCSCENPESATPEFPHDQRVSVAGVINGFSQALRESTAPLATSRKIFSHRGAKVQGVRTGNWLNKHQAGLLINRPDTTT
jgi:hypothetical protein